MALMGSLFFWEPDVSWCVVVDDWTHSRRLTELGVLPPTCRAVTLLNPRQGRGRGHTGGLSLGVMTALSWIQRHTDADLVLKIDTDALVIAPFSNRAHAFVSARTHVGMIGSLGLSCNPVVRERDAPKRQKDSFLFKLYQNIPVPDEAVDEEWLRTAIDIAPGQGRPSAEQIRAYIRLRPHIGAAIRNGFQHDDFCLGGAYIVTRQMLDRMASARYFDQADAWLWMPPGEDRVISMYARSVGLTFFDCASPGDIFGLQWHGLPYQPAELLERQYSIIHSVRFDERHSESDIRRYFATLRVRSLT